MPCDGVVVLQFSLEKQNEAVREVLEALGPYVVQRQTDKGIVKLAVALPLPQGGTMPVKIAVAPGGRITAITQTGTFEVGKEVLQRWLAQLKASGVKTTGVKFESHRHDHHAPQLAYSTAQRQR